MPIGRMLTEAAFDLAAVKALTTAYEDVLATLGLKMRTDPLTQMIARKIIEHAQRGERDHIQRLEGAGGQGPLQRVSVIVVHSRNVESNPCRFGDRSMPL